MANVFQSISSYLSSYFSQQKSLNIAILEPDRYAAIEKIRGGFIDKLYAYKEFRCDFRSLNAYGSKDKLQDHTYKILYDRFDLIFAIGSAAALAAKKATATMNRTTPIIFGDVKDPSFAGLIDTYDFTKTNLTGVVTFNRDYLKQLEYLLTLFPTIKKIMLVYNPLQEQGMVKKEKEMVEEYLAHHNKDFISIDIYSKSDIVSCVGSAITMHQPHIIFTLRDITVMGGMADLLKVSFAHNVPVYTSDLESVRQGAIAGAGFSEYRIGEEAAKLAYLTYQKNMCSERVPLAMLYEPYQIRVNRRSLALCGITLGKNALELLQQHGEAL